METARDPNPTIVDLIPIEIFRHIISHFCSHCNGDIGDDNNTANVKVLVALTQTNREFRSIAMPILFHSISPHLPSMYVFRVLDDHPYLAQAVKHLSLPLSTAKSSSIMDDSALFTRFADRLSLNGEWTETTQISAVDGEMCLAMALFSDIERLKIHIADDQIVGHTRHFELLYSLLENYKHEEIFPKVRHLDIDKTQCINLNLCDPETIFFMRGAPHLQRLILRGSGGETFTDQNSDIGIEEFCSGVKDVIELQIMDFPFFTGTWQVIALERILGATQNLEAFKFVVDDYSCWYAHAKISPAQLLEYLNPQTQKTLQRLSLNFDSRTWPRHHNLQEPKPITPHQIKRFTKLVTLEVDSSCYYSHTVQQNNDEVIYEQDTYLVDFLPQTVQSLTIFFNRSAMYDILDDITYLGQQTVAGSFPSLKRVQIDAPIRYTMPRNDIWDDGWDNAQLAKLSAEMNVRREEFQRAFVGSDVDTQFRSWHIWE